MPAPECWLAPCPQWSNFSHVTGVSLLTNSASFLEVWVFNFAGLAFELLAAYHPGLLPLFVQASDGQCFLQNSTLWHLNAPVLHFQSFKIGLTNLCIKFSVKITGVWFLFSRLDHQGSTHVMEFSPVTTHCRTGMLDLRVTLFPFAKANNCHSECLHHLVAVRRPTPNIGRVLFETSEVRLITDNENSMGSEWVGGGERQVLLLWLLTAAARGRI